MMSTKKLTQPMKTHTQTEREKVRKNKCHAEENQKPVEVAVLILDKR